MLFDKEQRVTNQQEIIKTKVGVLELESARERVLGVQGNGLFPRQLLQAQAPVRDWR